MSVQVSMEMSIGKNNKHILVIDGLKQFAIEKTEIQTYIRCLFSSTNCRFFHQNHVVFK